MFHSFLSDSEPSDSGFDDSSDDLFELNDSILSLINNNQSDLVESPGPTFRGLEWHPSSINQNRPEGSIALTSAGKSFALGIAHVFNPKVNKIKKKIIRKLHDNIISPNMGFRKMKREHYRCIKSYYNYYSIYMQEIIKFLTNNKPLIIQMIKDLHLISIRK